MGFSFSNNGDGVQQWLLGYRVGGGTGALAGGGASEALCLLTSGGLGPAAWGPPDGPSVLSARGGDKIDISLLG